MRNTIPFLGVRVDVVDTLQLCERIVALARHEKRKKVMYLNTDCSLIALRDASYRKVLNSADLVYADGVGIVWGAKVFGETLPGRSTGADFIYRLCRMFAEHNLSVYLLGAEPGIVERAAERMQAVTPGLKVAGTMHGYFDQREHASVIENINKAEPDVLLVGFGAPMQELWIHDHHDELQVAVMWGVGGLFDFVSGKNWRGPQWLLDMGFEWLCRLFSEPRRLWRRYVLGSLLFIYYVLFHRVAGTKSLAMDE